MKQEAKELLKLCHKYNVNLIINDNVALAAKVGADGVHIGQSDMGVEKARAILGKEKIIGVTAKDGGAGKGSGSGRGRLSWQRGPCLELAPKKMQNRWIMHFYRRSARA